MSRFTHLLLLPSCALLLLAEGAPISQQHEDDQIVEAAIGAILLSYEKQLAEKQGSYNSLELSKLIHQQAKSIRSLPPIKRCDFFWTVAMTVDLNGGYAYALCELIASDCREEFIKRATKLLDDPGTLDQRRIAALRKYVDCVSRI